MTSGLKFGASLSQSWKTAFDPTAQMVFARDDMAAMARAAPREAAPGAKFQYSNGNTLLLSAMVREAAGGDGAAVTRFAHAQLFDKLGMTRPVLELDAVGTPIGASHMWATARDWARFGALYADDGVVGGERLLPQGWVDYSARLPVGPFEVLGFIDRVDWIDDETVEVIDYKTNHHHRHHVVDPPRLEAAPGGRGCPRRGARRAQRRSGP